VAGILALLSAASITSVLSDYVTAPAMKILAVVLSTVSGFISLLHGFVFKESEIHELYSGASNYLNLRERSQRVLLNTQLDIKQRLKALEEIQHSYTELDSKFQRFVCHPGYVKFSSLGSDGSAKKRSIPLNSSGPRSKPPSKVPQFRSLPFHTAPPRRIRPPDSLPPRSGPPE
jgi:hypothetical protein